MNQPHFCPYCELAFMYHNEVVDHIRHDHREHASSVAGIEPHELPYELTSGVTTSR